MTRIDLANSVAAITAVLAAVAAATLGSSAVPPAPRAAIMAPAVTYMDLPGGERGIADAGGTIAPVRAYRHIVSASTVTDWMLSELVEPERVAAYTEQSMTQAPWRYRFAGRRAIVSLANIEALLALEPDLVLIDNYGDPRRVARLREHGLAVFDIGEMRGVDALVLAIRRVGALIDRAERGERLAQRFERSLDAIAAHIPERDRPRAMYVSAYSSELYGGTKKTTYHDVLIHAGLVDAAAARFEGWPQYTAEHLLALDPDFLVTRTGGTDALCRHAGLDALRACRMTGRVIELDGFILDDPGLGILEATEALYMAIYGSATGTGSKELGASTRQP